MASRESSSAFRFHFVMLGVWCIGLSFTLFLSNQMAAAEQREHDLRLDREANERFEAFTNGLDEAAYALDVTNRLFAILGDVSREQFNAFVEPLQSNYPYILSFAYQRIIRQAQRAEFEASMRWFARDFRIHEIRGGKRVPAAHKPMYRVVDYLFPLDGNEAALGVDVLSISEMEEAAARAAVTGEITSTRLYRLVRGNGKDLGFTMIKPVYETSAKPAGLNTGASTIIGYTAVVFDARNLVRRILAQGGFLAENGYAVTVYSGADLDEAELIYSHPEHGPEHTPAKFGASDEGVVRTFDIAGTPWRMVVSRTSPHGAGVVVASKAVLILGLLLTAALSMYLRSAAHRVVALKNANSALEEDIMLREKAQQALIRSEAELRELASHQQRIREDERKHMAREIHDDLGQHLLVLRMDVSAIAANIGEKCPEAKARLDDVVLNIDATIKSARDIINHLRPSVLDLGAYEALRWLVGHMNKLDKVHFSFECADEDAFSCLNEEQATSVFRAVQESMTNVVRHANATSSTIRACRSEQALVIDISDNGRGVFPNDKRKPRSFGLIGIRERISAIGGTCTLSSTPEDGTTLHFRIPVSTEGSSGQQVESPHRVPESRRQQEGSPVLP